MLAALGKQASLTINVMSSAAQDSYRALPPNFALQLKSTRHQKQQRLEFGVIPPFIFAWSYCLPRVSTPQFQVTGIVHSRSVVCSSLCIWREKWRTLSAGRLLKKIALIIRIRALRQAYQAQQSNIQMQGIGTVIRLLSDDTQGARHQRFILKLSHPQTLLVAHSIDLAPRIPHLRLGDVVEFYGEYE